MSEHRQRFAGRVAVVTGAGSTACGEVVGIGRAIATQLALEGARVAVLDLDGERAEQTRSAIAAEGGEAIAVIADVSREDDCARAMREVETRLGPVSVLVNNVGVAQGAGKLETLETDLWNRMLETNLSGAMYMAKHAVPQFRRAGGGSMVHIASIGGMRAAGAGVCYSSTKAAMVALSRELALLYGRERIRSNVVAPGHVYTPIAIDLFDDNVRTMRRKVSPLNIEGTAWHVAKAVAFLASDDAEYITGALLPVDGGVTTLGAFAAYGLITGDD